MEKRDVIMVVVGLAIVMIIAFVAKPMFTGKPVDMSVPVSIPGLPTPTPTPVPVDEGYAKYLQERASGLQAPAPPPVTTIPTPTPTPTWSGESRGLGFVDPAQYKVTPTPTPIPHSGVYKVNETVADNLVTYATIQGNSPGTTEPIHMPFPYWVMKYTVDPWETTFTGTTANKAAGVADSFGTEVFPSFEIKVMDADKPNQTVRVVEPQGGLDATLWKKGTGYDPRPWVEEFYEGVENRDYYFVITPHMVHSYRIDILVPERYVGKY